MRVGAHGAAIADGGGRTMLVRDGCGGEFFFQGTITKKKGAGNRKGGEETKKGGLFLPGAAPENKGSKGGLPGGGPQTTARAGKKYNRSKKPAKGDV